MARSVSLFIACARKGTCPSSLATAGPGVVFARDPATKFGTGPKIDDHRRMPTRKRSSVRLAASRTRRVGEALGLCGLMAASGACFPAHSADPATRAPAPQVEAQNTEPPDAAPPPPPAPLKEL